MSHLTYKSKAFIVVTTLDAALFIRAESELWEWVFFSFLFISFVFNFYKSTKYN